MEVISVNTESPWGGKENGSIAEDMPSFVAMFTWTSVRPKFTSVQQFEPVTSTSQKMK